MSVAAQRLALAAPETVSLARALSLAVRAEPALVRAARLRAGLPAITESDLWFSDLVASAGPLGLALDPAIADVLRAELSDDEREDGWALLQEHHGREPWSIRLEERINYLGTGAEIEELIAAALDELSETDETAALGIARWLLAALGRLPATVQAGSAAAAAGIVAGAHLDGRIGDLDELTDEQRETWLPKLLGGLGTTELRARLVPGALILGGNDGPPIRVPATDPIALSVDGVDVRLRAGEERRVPVSGSGPVTVRTISGSESMLVPYAVGRLTHEGRDIGPACAIDYATVITASARLSGREYVFEPAGGSPVECLARHPREGWVAWLDLAEDVIPAVPGSAVIGERWRFADGRPGGGTIIGSDGRDLVLAEDVPSESEHGLAVVLERPWGGLFGVLIGTAGENLLAAPADIDYIVDDEAEELGTPDPDMPVLSVSELTLEHVGLAPHPIFGETYLPRDVDQLLDDALGRSPIVGITGPGRARTAFEALRRRGPETVVAFPRGGAWALDEAFRDMRVKSGSFIWVDVVGPELTPFDDLEYREDVTIVALFDSDPSEYLMPDMDLALATLHPTFSSAEIENAWQILGPELALNPERPFSEDELAMRERAVARARTEGRTEPLADALRGQGLAFARAGMTGPAIGTLSEGLKVFRTAMHANRATVAERLLELAVIQGPSRGGIAHAEEAVSLTPLSSDEHVRALNVLADLLTRMRWIDEAIRRASEAARQVSERDPDLLAETYGTLARALIAKPDEGALDAARTAVDVRRRVGEMLPLVRALETLADAHEALGDDKAAVDASADALDAARGLDDADVHVRVLDDVARRLDRVGSLEDALAASAEAVAAARPQHTELPRILLGHARRLADTARDEEAHAAATEALQLLMAWSDRPERERGRAEAVELVADLNARMGRTSAAISGYEEAVRLLGWLGDAEGQERVREKLAAR